MKAIIAIVALLAFVSALPGRYLPSKKLSGMAIAAPESPLERFYVNVPPVRREVGSINFVAQAEEVRPAFGIAWMLYALAFYSIFSNGIFGLRVYQFVDQFVDCVSRLIVAGCLYVLPIALPTVVAVRGLTGVRFVNPDRPNAAEPRIALQRGIPLELPLYVKCCLVLIGIGFTVSLFISR